MYLALYRKWRPRTFDDVIGQEHITKTLKSQVNSGKTAHSYLFTGSRGTGKTTCSKILAMAVNCLNPKDGNPCMECENCKGIASGAVLDVLEIDAASNNGVDDVRVLREEANYTPSQCKYRVYIIDETHMLSISAFNALLKIMEEPPPHVKFILATTEVHKVPATVLSRCQRFDFMRISTENLARHLLFIAEHESFTLNEAAAFLIARLADGGMRDAISLLDQCTSYSDNIDTQIVAKATGLILRDYLFKITDLIEDKNSSEAISCIDELYSGSKDLQKLISELIEHYRNLMLVKTVNDPTDLIRCVPEELEQMKVQAAKIPLSSVLRYISVLQDCLDKIARDFDKRLCTEIAIIRLCTPDFDDSKTALLSRIEQLENAVKNGITVKTSAVSPTPVADKPAAIPVAATTVVYDTNMAAATVSTATNVAEATSETDKKPTSEISEFTLWNEILSTLITKDPMMSSILSGSTAFVTGDFIYIDSPLDLFASMLKKDNLVKKLKDAIAEKTGRSYKLRIKKAKTAPKVEVSAINDIKKIAANLEIEVTDSQNK